MSEEIGQVESCDTRRHRKLPTMAVLGAAVVLAYLPRFLVHTFYIEGIRSTNDWVVFVLSPVATLTLTVVLTIILVRRFPSLAAFDCIWLRRTRREAILLWLLPLGIIVAVACTALPIWRFELSLRKDIAFAEGYDAYRNTALLVWMAVCSALLFPVTEEIFWRGYVQSTLLRICHPVVAVSGQAILFGLIHFRPAMGFLQASLIGLIFGIWCYRRKTLLPVIVMHIIFNSALTGLDIPDWIEMRQMRDSRDYVAEFIELSRPAGYDPNDDAREEYAEAHRLVVPFPNEFKELRKRYPTQWSHGEQSRVEDWIASNSEAISLAEKGAKKPYYWVEYERLNERMPPLARGGEETRCLVFALDMRAELRAVQGEYRKAFSDVETCYRLGRHWVANKDLLSQLVGYACRGISLQTTRAILSHEKIDASLLSHVQGLLRTFAQDDVSGCDLTVDRLFAMDFIQCMFTDDGKGSGRVPRAGFRKQLLPDGQFESPIGAWSSFGKAEIRAWRKLDRRKTTADVHKYYDLAEQACLLSPWQFQEDSALLKSQMEWLRRGNVLIRTLTPAIERLLATASRAYMDRDATIAVLAVLQYQADMGYPPGSLFALVAEDYLEAVPQDVYRHGPLIYRRTGDDFLLYSFGADFDDDGGTASKWGEGEKGGDQVFWPVSDSEPPVLDENPNSAD